MTAGTPAESDGDAGAERTLTVRTWGNPQHLRESLDDLLSVDPDVAWRAIDRRKRKQERRIAAGQATEFRRQGSDAVRRFRAAASQRDFKHITASMILDLAAMLDGHTSQLTPAVRDAIRSGWATAAARIKLGAAVDFDDARIRDVLDRLNRQMNGVVETTVGKVNNLLEHGIREGWTTEQMAQAIDRQFKQFSIVRSQIIAQTSGTAAFESAQQAAYKRGGVQKKQWLTQRDGAVRPAHIVADGDTVEVDQPFTVDGESLEYPGDPAGSAGNVINCRCSMLPVIEDEPTA